MKTFLALVLSISLGSAVSQDVKVEPTISTVKWLGKKATGEHNGTINVQEGTLEMDGNKLTGGSFSIDMTTINCEDLPGRAKTKLENHLKSDDFFGVQNHPKATFVITKVKATGSGVYQVTGDMTIKNITKEIQFPARVVKNGNKVEATADLMIDRAKFNVRYGSGSFFDDLGDRLIYDDFEISVSLLSK
ncbi:MAG: YceI family protein [Bacteroidota bacterium]